jgi:DeoR/GlpR family transcriptional regulator of sugar metabolism
MTERAGFTTPNLLGAETHQALIECGARLVVTADHTKWGVAGISTISRLSRADIVITDRALDLAAQTVLRSEVGELVLAGAEEPQHGAARSDGRSRPLPLPRA